MARRSASAAAAEVSGTARSASAMMRPGPAVAQELHDGRRPIRVEPQGVPMRCHRSRGRRAPGARAYRRHARAADDAAVPEAGVASSIAANAAGTARRAGWVGTASVATRSCREAGDRAESDEDRRACARPRCDPRGSRRGRSRPRCASAKTAVNVYFTKRIPRSTGRWVASSPNAPAFRTSNPTAKSTQRRAASDERRPVAPPPRRRRAPAPPTPIAGRQQAVRERAAGRDEERWYGEARERRPRHREARELRSAAERQSRGRAS